MTHEPRACAECGKEYTPPMRHGPPLQVCSIGCFRIRERRWQARPDRKAEYHCVVCGKEYTPPKRRGAILQVCSDECKLKRRRERARA